MKFQEAVPEFSLTRGTLWNVLGKGIPLLSLIAFVPYLLTHLGSQRFGLLALLMAIVGYASVFNFGLGKAVTYEHARLLRAPKGSYALRFQELVWTALVTQIALGILAFTVAFMLAPGLTQLIDINESLRSEAVLALRIVALAFPVIFVVSTFRGLLESRAMFGPLNLAQAPVVTLQYMVPAALVYFGGKLPEIAIGLLATYLLLAIVLAVLCARYAMRLEIKPRINGTTLRGLVSYGGWLAIPDAAYPILTYADRFVVAVAVGVSGLPFYAVPSDIITRLWMLPTSLVAVVFPWVSHLHPKEDFEKAAALCRDSVMMISLILGPLCVLVTASAGPILAAWMGHDFSRHATPLLQIMLLGFFLNSVAMVGSAVLQAWGHTRARAMLVLVEVPVYAVALAVLVISCGLQGAAAAWTIRMVITMVGIYVLLWKKTGLAGAHMFSSALSYHFLATTLCLGLSVPLLASEPASSAGVSVLYMALTVWIALSDPKIRTLVRRIRNDRRVAT